LIYYNFRRLCDIDNELKYMDYMGQHTWWWFRWNWCAPNRTK